MTQKGHAVVDALCRSYRELLSKVVVARDPATSGDFSDQIISVCDDYSVPHTERSKAPPAVTKYSMAVGWRWLIETSAESQLVVFHDSLLPRYRGFNPLVTALVNGDRECGVTALLASDDYDCGDIIAQARRPLEYPIQIQQAIDLLCPAYRELALGVAAMMVAGIEIQGTPQNNEDATYSLWRDEEDYRIDWARSAEWIQRFVGAVGPPYRGALTVVNGVRARVYGAEAVDDVTIENRDCGKVVFIHDGRPIVVCGSGLLLITELVAESDETSLLPLTRFRTRFS